MQRWKLTLAYDGTDFHGWQVQPRLPTVQGTVATALADLTGEQVLPQGSGRTDTGVHALGQVASFALEAPIPPQNLMRALNRALPPAIRVLAAEHAAASFHARHDAVRKTYEYRIFARRGPGSDQERVCPPMLAPYVWDCPFDFDFDDAQQAAQEVVGEHDFSSFAASDPDLAERREAAQRSSVRTILHSQWTREPGLHIYRVTGTGFLHHMVRNLVGTFAEAARGRFLPSSIAQILAARDRTLAGPTAPACGLFLVSVDYPAEPGEVDCTQQAPRTEAMA